MKVRSIKKNIALLVTAVLLILLFASYRRMYAYRDSFDRRDVLIAGSIPAQVYLPEVQKSPVVVVAHGITGDKEMMQSLAYSLVRDGFAVVTFDFRGHGRNDTGFDRNRLQEDMAQVVYFARGLNEKMPSAFGRGFKEADTKRIAIIGHSMGGGAVLNYALHDSDIDATVSISAVTAGTTEKLPKNLFIMYAQNDPPGFDQAARQMLNDSTEEEEHPVANKTYGSFKYGSARRLSMIKGTDHITILFSADAHRQILNWLHQVWEMPPGDAEVSDPRLAWMGLAYVLSLLLFLCCCYGLSWYLPEISKRTGKEVALNLVGFAVICLITLFIIMLAPPLSFLPMWVGDYLVSYYFVVGVLYFLFASRRGNIDFAHFTSSPARTILASFVLFLLAYVTFGAIATETWYHQFFTAQRLIWALVMLPLLLPFFVAFEASFKRGNTLVASVASLLGVLIVLGMLVLGVGLQISEDFIVILIPAMTIYNVIFQLLSIYVYHLSGNYFATALFHAMIMAWQYAVLFPVS